ncbi:hypothetical protein DRE_01013 [Drechslerella stenobrocha 248]|uniref:Elongation of fatty acids protein n=1 Tax=Drechslerella stenobrocha 248 TaxID=1043628 RepID=W7HP82_9PEZI|nr:hypothetical protein DRE_01013 [Drechslerella stenobrocha 248]
MSVRLVVPPSSFFSFNNASQPIPPSIPHAIPSDIYTSLLDVRVPITIAAVYAITVHYLNGLVSKSSPPTPYGFAKTASFKYFVILHNALLAVYSAWTFVGITSTLRRTISWDNGLGGFVHGLCKIHDDSVAVGINDVSGLGGVSRIAGSGLWEEGLAFYGWLFYLSKFYEVIDTAIILAKGRKSSTLQTYHHAGAMMCMWAGIRFMSPPIFLFVLFNSAIHTLMYTYYTLSAFKVRVPMVVKRMLTTMQITQFLVGGSGAAIQIFVSYVPPAVLTDISDTIKENSGIDVGMGKLNREFVSCLGGGAEVWAVVTNVVYLTPLTYLFVMFFIKSYLAPRRTGKPTSASASAEVKTAQKAVVG